MERLRRAQLTRTPAPPVRLLTSDSALIFTRKTDSLSSDKKITLISLGTTLSEQACHEYICSGGHRLAVEFVFASSSLVPMLIHQPPIRDLWLRTMCVYSVHICSCVRRYESGKAMWGASRGCRHVCDTNLMCVVWRARPAACLRSMRSEPID